MEKNKAKNILKSSGKIAGKGVAAIGILGLSGLGVKIANDIAQSAYRDCKALTLQEGRKIKNELQAHEEDEEDE